MNETMTIAEIAIEYYLPAKRQRRRTNTVDGYESSIRLYVVPRWGDMAIADIDPDEVQAWVDELAKEAGPGGAWKAFKCLRQIVRWALAKWRLRVYDPTQHVERPRTPTYKPETLTHRRL